MSIHSIFQHRSFLTLDETQKKQVRDYAEDPMPSLIGTQDVCKNQKELSVSLDFWDYKINVLNQFTSCPEGFQSMSEEQQRMLHDELRFALYLFCARFQLDFAEGHGDAMEDRGSQIQKCKHLIKMLGGQTSVTDQLPTVEDDGISTGLDWMDSFNERRLYWVWAGRGGLLGSVISLLPDNFYHKIQALKALDVLVPFTGFLSWALYYFRFSIRAGILIQHTLPGRWMSDEERAIPWQERLTAQLQAMKFDLLNDFVWATGNLVCFFWLYGNAILDFYAGILTAVLLLMDVSVTIAAHWEEYTQYSIDMDRSRSVIQRLRDHNAPMHQLNALKYTERQCKLERDYKLYALYADMLYAVSLLLAFSLLYCFFLPVSLTATTALIFEVSGTVLCFSLNALFAAMKQGIDLCKSVERSNDIAQDHATSHDYFDKSLLASEWDYQQAIIAYKQACLLRAVLIDVLVPPVVFVALVFMPLSIGLPVISAGFILAVASYYYVDNHIKHDITSLPAFSPETMHLPKREISPIITQGFFGEAAGYLHEKRRLDIVMDIPSH